MYEENTLSFKDCDAEKGFPNESSHARHMVDAICSVCGKPVQIPFEPRNGYPVYCSECFAALRG